MNEVKQGSEAVEEVRRAESSTLILADQAELRTRQLLFGERDDLIREKELILEQIASKQRAVEGARYSSQSIGRYYGGAPDGSEKHRQFVHMSAISAQNIAALASIARLEEERLSPRLDQIDETIASLNTRLGFSS